MRLNFANDFRRSMANGETVAAVTNSAREGASTPRNDGCMLPGVSDVSQVLEQAITLTPDERVQLTLKVIESFGDLDDLVRDSIPFGTLRIALLDAPRPDLSRADDPRIRALWAEARRRFL